MARDRDTFGLALGRLREDLRDGRIRPGEALTTSDLAASLKISATPIREAIARLTGEGLVQDLRGRGVFALSYAVSEVEELYLLHGACVGLACELRREHHHHPVLLEAWNTLPSVSPLAFREKTERFWEMLVRGAGGGALARTHQRVTDQLAVLRLVEPIVFKDLVEELAAMIRLAQFADADQILLAVHSYHQRRIDVSWNISTLIRDPTRVL